MVPASLKDCMAALVKAAIHTLVTIFPEISQTSDQPNFSVFNRYRPSFAACKNNFFFSNEHGIVNKI